MLPRSYCSASCRRVICRQRPMPGRCFNSMRMGAKFCSGRWRNSLWPMRSSKPIECGQLAKVVAEGTVRRSRFTTGSCLLCMADKFRSMTLHQRVMTGQSPPGGLLRPRRSQEEHSYLVAGFGLSAHPICSAHRKASCRILTSYRWTAVEKKVVLKKAAMCFLLTRSIRFLSHPPSIGARSSRAMTCCSCRAGERFGYSIAADERCRRLRSSSRRNRPSRPCLPITPNWSVPRSIRTADRDESRYFIWMWLVTLCWPSC